MSRHSMERVVGPLAAGLLVLLALLGLIGTAIRDPRPHDIPVGLVGPAQAVQPMADALAQKAPAVFKFATYDTEDAARAALDRRDVDGVVIVGPTGSRIVVAGAAGDTSTTVIESVFGAALSAQGQQVPVEVVHPFASGDAHGLILFFLVLATLVSTLVVQAGQLNSALRGTLYFGGEGVAFPVLVISAWLAVGLLLVIISGFVRRPVAESAAARAA